MTRIIFYIFLCSIFGGSLIAQQRSELKDLKREYESFNYKEVVNLADRLLADTAGINKPDIIEIYLLKAIAHYSLDEEDQVRASFIEILKLNKDYSIDPSRVSPKIINLFEKVKSDYMIAVETTQIPAVTKERDTVFVRQPDTLFVRDNIARNALWRSIILPGWGHLYAGDKTKGYILTGLGGAALASMIYFIVDTNQKEKDYLNETDAGFIEQRYSDFNQSYKIRNGLIVAYAIIWIYSQLDLLVFNKSISNSIPSSKLSTQFISNSLNELHLSFRYNF